MGVRVTILPVLHRLRDVAFVSSFVCFSVTCLACATILMVTWNFSFDEHDIAENSWMSKLMLEFSLSWNGFRKKLLAGCFFSAVDAAIIATLQSLASICRKIRGSGQPVQAIKLFQGLEKLVSTSIFDTGLSYFMAWSLQSYPTAVFNERMWYFRGSKHTLTLLHIFSGIRTPYPHDPRPWLR